MINKINSTATEYMTKRVNENIKEVSPILYEKARDFLTRNSLPPEGVCCARCLKAFLVHESRKRHINFKLEKEFKCEAGHLGYFMDKGKVFKVY